LGESVVERMSGCVDNCYAMITGLQQSYRERWLYTANFSIKTLLDWWESFLSQATMVSF